MPSRGSPNSALHTLHILSTAHRTSRSAGTGGRHQSERPVAITRCAQEGEHKIGAQAAVAAYKSLALVERAFRTLKGVDLQVRPVYHWLDTRVKAHVFLCMLAYYVEHHMRAALAPILFADHQPQARTRPSIVRPAEPSVAAKQKIARRQAHDGTPIVAWHDLIANLGTLTLNEVALPLGQGRTIHMLARPTALQEQAFALLSVPLPCVQ